MKIRSLKIVLINLKQYNNDQLLVVSEYLGIVGDYLQKLKLSNASKVWISVNDDNKIIEAVCATFTDIKDSVNTYKDSGLIILNDFKDLSKKEKDLILKMKPTEFKTKRKKNNFILDDVDIESLKDKLKICIHNEEYEKAAKLRDKINSLSK